MIRCVLIDFGNVLAYPATGNWFYTPESGGILERCGIPRGVLREMEGSGRFDRAYHYLDGHHLLHTIDEELEQFAEFYRLFLEDQGDADQAADLLARELVLSEKKAPFYEDACSGLYELQKRYRLAVLSDNWPSLRPQLDRAGITRLLEGLIISCDYGMCKDRVEFFQAALETLRFPAAETAFIDDSEDNLRVAVKAGLTPILMDRERLAGQSVYPVAHDMEGVLTILSRLEGGGGV